MIDSGFFKSKSTSSIFLNASSPTSSIKFLHFV
jgi:hypothetical protein